MSGDSYIVSFYGLDGVREHWIPGNRKRGREPRPKRGYATEADARAAADRAGTRRGRPFETYQCGVCQEWHLASPKRT